MLLKCSTRVFDSTGLGWGIKVCMSHKLPGVPDAAASLFGPQFGSHFLRLRDPSVQFSSVAQSCLTFCDPMNRSRPGLPVHHQLPEFCLKLTSIESVMPSSHLILCRPLLLLPPIPPSIRVFSNESTLQMMWPKYWIFSFSIIPSKEIPGLISFRMDW